MFVQGISVQLHECQAVHRFIHKNKKEKASHSGRNSGIEAFSFLSSVLSGLSAQQLTSLSAY
jgi:hypothetical protein